MADTSERKPRWRIFAHMRLRTRLAIIMSVAALLPVLVVATVAVSVVLRNLDGGLQEETRRQLDVGLNLLLRNVERLGHEAVRLSSAGDLQRAMNNGPEAIDNFLARESPHLPSSLVQVGDERGNMLSERVIGGVEERFEGLRVGPQSPSVQAGLSFERRVTLVRVDDRLVVRAVAPVVDASYMLEGVVVITVPLDGEFADGVKGALGADVLLSFGDGSGAQPASTTFLDAMGTRREVEVNAKVAARVVGGESVVAKQTILGREYSLGYTPLTNLSGEPLGVFAVAVDREALVSAKKAATRSLALGAAGAFLFALGLASLLSRRITKPIARLHTGAVAIARGDLDQRISLPEGDEIGDLAQAFSHMTEALKENQARLAARMREIVALHDAGRAVSSSINRNQVIRKVVDSVARVLDVRLCALWLVDDSSNGGPTLSIGAVRAKLTGVRTTMRGDEGKKMAEPLESIAREVARARATLRVDRVGDDKRRRQAALAAGITGSLLATPLERKGQILGVIIVGRGRDARPFSEANSNLLATFADQAATAIENAGLYEEVREFNEELEAKVKLRTSELTAINAELGRAFTELRETQSQLILSERLAGLGLLVAGVAHEINSPSAAIRGSVDAMEDNVSRLAEMAEHMADPAIPLERRRALLELVREIGPQLAGSKMPTPAAARRTARSLRGEFEDAGLEASQADEISRELAQLAADEAFAARLAPLLAGLKEEDATSADVLVGYLLEYVYLHRNALTIQNAIKKIQRIVGALKSYSHLDQKAALVEADIHEGIEDTIVILDYVLRGITVERRFGKLPAVPVYVDELNQVWTNLIHNASQALQGQGTIALETGSEGDGVFVRVIDDGPGIENDVRLKIFEPFFTTKPKGEGTGLGLGIVRQIVEKHQGRVTCDSEPGRTCFQVWLPCRREPATDNPPAGEDSADANAS